MAEVTRVRVELREQNGRLQAELTAQEALKEKVAALERQLKGELSPSPAPSRQDLCSPDYLTGGWAAELGSAGVCAPGGARWCLHPQGTPHQPHQAPLRTSGLAGAQAAP